MAKTRRKTNSTRAKSSHRRSTARPVKAGRTPGSGRQAARRPRRSGAVDATGKHLVIVESPTKAKTINKYLGPDYVVMASVGHVRDLPKRAPKGIKQEIPGIDLENDFNPTYEILANKKKTVTELRRVAKEADDIWFATDLDREGEAIAWHLAEALGVPTGQAKRVVFNAITKSEIEHAFTHPRVIDENRVNAQQARRILDRIVGYQISPFLWKKVAGGLSAGRVQSVAVRLVAERERKIEQFIPKEYWKITGYFAANVDRADDLSRAWRKWIDEHSHTYNKETTSTRTNREKLTWLSEHQCIQAELIQYNNEEFKDSDSTRVLEVAEKLGFVLENHHEWEEPKAKGPEKHQVRFSGHVDTSAAEYQIKSIETKRTISRPSAPFITSTLQQAAANKLGFPLQRTMRVAQQLYEGIDIHGIEGQTGLITYMRTDSTHLTGESIEMGRSYIGSQWGSQYLPKDSKVYKSPNASAQEAHEAIRPTDVSITPKRLRKELTDEQYKLYQLIWERFLASQMMPAQWDATTILIEGTGQEHPLFKATGRKLVFDGFYKVTGIPNGELILPELEHDQSVIPIDIDPKQHFTNPPPRYTEASLQKKLEEEGIGRPSTYAPIIQTIQDRKYVEPVEPRDRRLRSTDLGTVVSNMLTKAFPEVMNVAYTRHMEQELDKIEEDHLDWVNMLRDFYGPFKTNLDTAHKQMTHAKAESLPAPHTCSKCGAPTEYRFGRNGRFLSCTAYYVPPEPVKLKQFPRKKLLLYKAKGKARPKIISEDGNTRVGWTKLTPEQKEQFQKLSEQMPTPCDYAAPIDSEGNPMEPQVCDIVCPACDGPMTKRVGRFGPFLGCADYPTCKGIVNIDPKKHTIKLPKPPPLLTELTCPKCEQAPLNLRRSKRGPWLSCSTFPKCRGRLAWSDVEQDHQQALEKALAEHEMGHPQPVICNTQGQVVDENYVPNIPEEQEGPTDAASTFDSDAA